MSNDLGERDTRRSTRLRRRGMFYWKALENQRVSMWYGPIPFDSSLIFELILLCLPLFILIDSLSGCWCDCDH